MLIKISPKNDSIIIEKEESEKNSYSKNFTIIESKGFVSKSDIKEIWKYRELLYFLALRDVKIRYKQTLLGIAWVLVQPIVTTIIFTTLFLKLGVSPNIEIPYPLFTFSGFTLWFFISSSISNCSGSLLNHSNLVTKVYFPRLIIPISAILATFVDLFFGIVSLFLVMLVYQVSPNWHIIFIFILLVPTVLLSLGVGILAAALNVKYRDVKYILPFIIQIFFYISPIFYSLSMLPEDTIWIWKYNPLTGILENFRALLFGLPFDWVSFILSMIISLLLFIFSVFIFHRMEDHFADVI